MKLKFELSINTIQVINELPGAWAEQDCLALLEELEFEDVANIPKDQLRDYATMALQDLEDHEAAGALLDHVFGDSLSDGQKQNLAEEMTGGRLWEEYPDLSCHERIFLAQVLLHQAFPGTPRPEINKVEGVLSSLNQAAESYLQKHSPDRSPRGIPEALIVRSIAAAISPTSILARLFEDQIKGEVPFAEAEHILWQVSSELLPPQGERRQRYQLTIYSPIRWTAELEEESMVECEPFVRDEVEPG